MYHGEGGWGHPVAFEALLDLEGALLDELRPHVPCFSFVLDDLSVARDDELRARTMSALGRVALFCLKRSRGSDMADELARWRDLLAEIVAAPNGVAVTVKTAVALFTTTAGRRKAGGLARYSRGWRTARVPTSSKTSHAELGDGSPATDSLLENALTVASPTNTLPGQASTLAVRTPPFTHQARTVPFWNGTYPRPTVRAWLRNDIVTT